MEYGKMIKSTKHVKNLKIYHAEHSSFRKLREKHFPQLIIGTESYREVMLELLLNIIRDINPWDDLPRQFFRDYMLDIRSIVEANHDIELPEYIIKKMSEDLYN